VQIIYRYTNRIGFIVHSYKTEHWCYFY